MALENHWSKLWLRSAIKLLRTKWKKFWVTVGDFCRLQAEDPCIGPILTLWFQRYHKSHSTEFLLTQYGTRDCTMTKHCKRCALSKDLCPCERITIGCINVTSPLEGVALDYTLPDNTITIWWVWECIGADRYVHMVYCCSTHTGSDCTYND